MAIPQTRKEAVSVLKKIFSIISELYLSTQTKPERFTIECEDVRVELTLRPHDSGQLLSLNILPDAVAHLLEGIYISMIPTDEEIASEGDEDVFKLELGCLIFPTFVSGHYSIVILSRDDEE